MATTKVQSELIADDVALAGNPTTTTQGAGNNTTRIATTAFVTAAIDSLVDSAPGTMNTLNEIAAALNDDANFNTTVTNAIAAKLPLAGGALTGNLTTNSRVAIGQSSVTGGNVLLDLHGSGSGVGAQSAYYNDHNTSGFFVGLAGNTTGNPIIYNVPNTNIEFYTNNAIAMIISSTGVGIGAAPSDNFDISSALPTLRLTDTDGGYHRIRGNGANLILQADEGDTQSNSSIEFHVDGSTVMQVDHVGRFRVGADSGDAFNADSMLRVGRTGDRAFMQFKTDADQNSGILFGDVDDDVECAIEYEPANKALSFSTGNNTEALRINTDQKIGIGTDSPAGLVTIHKDVTGANDQEMLTIMRDGGSTSDGARQASIAFFDGNNDTYVGKISGYRDSPAGNYDGGLRFYVNPHATNANATFAELNNTPALYMNPNQTSTFHGQAIIGQSSSAIGTYTSNNSGHTQLNYGKIGHQYNSTGTVHTFGTYTHPSAMYGYKTDGSTASWNRLLWINHRASYMITIWTSGGWYGPTAHTIKVDTSYTNTLSVKTISEGTAGSYSYAVRFTAPDGGTGGGWLDFQNTGGSSGGTAYSGIYISVTPLRGTDFVFASLKSEAAGDTVSTLTYTTTKTNASDY